MLVLLVLVLTVSPAMHALMSFRHALVTLCHAFHSMHAVTTLPVHAVPALALPAVATLPVRAVAA
ncbi:MAG: hypothetical protein JNM79_16070 [Burkholderiales bacterium]|nr:hypothetical protein [Burkholderiales bacterium]